MTTSDIDPTTLQDLTSCEAKRRAYAVDPYFRHGLRWLVPEKVLAVTFVVFKPDAVVGRRIIPAVDALNDAGFSPVSARCFRFTPLITREVWRYQFNIASWDRADVVDLLLPSTESLIVVLRDEHWKPGAMPAAGRFTALKGPADPTLRDDRELRTRLQSVNSLFNFVHSADEPADVVREIALFELATGLPLISDANRELVLANGALSALTETLYLRFSSHDLDASSSWRRLVKDDGPVSSIARRRLMGDDNIGWRDVLSAFGDEGPGAYLWDLLSVATAEIDCNVPGLDPVIPSMR